MKIEVVPFAKAVDAKTVSGKTVVVIDVLRATSVMINALQNGAKEIIPCASIEEAYRIADKLEEESYLLCGERNAVRIEGFDLGNSPLEYTPEIVKDKTILLTTTNGTRALKACSGAATILIGAFLNINAIVDEIKSLDEIVLVCSGTKGKFSLDDGICAAMILDGLSRNIDIETDDLGWVLLERFRSGKGDLKKILNDCFHLNDLVEMGYEKDVEYCLKMNAGKLNPYYNHDSVTLNKS